MYTAIFPVTLPRFEGWYVSPISPLTQVLAAKDGARPLEGFTPHSGVIHASLSPLWRGNEQSTSVQKQETKICNSTPGSSLGLQSGKQHRDILQVLLCYSLYNVSQNIFQVIHLQSSKNNGCCHLYERSRGAFVSDFILLRGNGTGV